MPFRAVETREHAGSDSLFTLGTGFAGRGFGLQAFLMFFVAEFLGARLAVDYDERVGTVGRNAQIISFRRATITAAHIVDASHHPRRGIVREQHVDTHRVVGPRAVSDDRVRQPSRRPTHRMDRRSLTQATALAVGPIAQFEHPIDVRGVMGKMPIGARSVIPFKVFTIWEGEALLTRWFAECAFRLAGGGGDRVDGFRIERERERSVLRRERGLLDKLLPLIAAPDAQGLVRQSATDVERDGLRRARVVGFHNDTIIGAGRFQGHERPASAQLAAATIEIRPSHFGELPVVRVAPKHFARAVEAAPGRIGDHGCRIDAVGLNGIERGNQEPVDDLRHTVADVVFIEGLDQLDFAVEAFEVDVFLGVPERFAERLRQPLHLRRSGYLRHRMIADDVDRVAQFRVGR